MGKRKSNSDDSIVEDSVVEESQDVNTEDTVIPEASEEPQTQAPLIFEEIVTPEPPKAKAEEKFPSDLVEVKVVIGTFRFEEGTFERGSFFRTTRERAAKFDQQDVTISEI